MSRRPDLRTRCAAEPYPRDARDHHRVGLDASEIYVRWNGAAGGAHSGHPRPESAHPLLSLPRAGHSH